MLEVPAKGSCRPSLPRTLVSVRALRGFLGTVQPSTVRYHLILRGCLSIHSVIPAATGSMAALQQLQRTLSSSALLRGLLAHQRTVTTFSHVLEGSSQQEILEEPNPWRPLPPAGTLQLQLCKGGPPPKQKVGHDVLLAKQSLGEAAIASQPRLGLQMMACPKQAIAPDASSVSKQLICSCRFLKYTCRPDRAEWFLCTDKRLMTPSLASCLAKAITFPAAV